MAKGIRAADEDLERAFMDWEKALHRGRKCYQKADAAAAEIIKRLKPNAVRRLSDGRLGGVRDNFARQNKVFKSAGVARLEPEVRMPDEI